MDKLPTQKHSLRTFEDLWKTFAALGLLLLGCGLYAAFRMAGEAAGQYLLRLLCH
jgi:hypothetical protein